MSNSLVIKVTFFNIRASMHANYECLWALILTKTRLDPKVKYGEFCSRNDVLSNDIKNKLKTTKWRYLHPKKGENLHKPVISCIYVHVSLQLVGCKDSYSKSWMGWNYWSNYPLNRSIRTQNRQYIYFMKCFIYLADL